MTVSPAAPIDPSYTRLPYGDTFQMIFPVEASGYAFRLGVADPFSEPMNILSASVYVSDSYSGAAPSFGRFTVGRPLTTLPTAHSVYQTCNVTARSTTIVCTDTSVLPSSATMYVIGQQGVLVANEQAKIVDAHALTISHVALATGTYRLQFANLAQECKIYFDNGGADVGTIDKQEVQRGLVVQGNPQSRSNEPQPYTLQWSDFDPCVIKSTRADGGRLPLLFVYLTVAANSVFGATSNHLQDSNPDVAPSFGGRFVFESRATTTNADFSDQPAGSPFLLVRKGSPFQVFQYLTDRPGWNVIQSGDSIATAPTEDHLSNGIWRACKLLSTPRRPCEWSSVAWGAQDSVIYNGSLANNIGALQPSALVAQPISRNDLRVDHDLLGSMQNLLAEAQNFVAGTDMRVGYYGAFPFAESEDNNVSYRQAVTTMLSTMTSVSQSCQNDTSGTGCPLVPVLNPIPIVTRAVLGGAFWDYLGIGFNARAAAAAGATSVSIVSANSRGTCYVGDILTDSTDPSAIAANTAVTTVSPTTLGVPATGIVGAGIAAHDALVCSMPGWTGGALTFDNTHPAYPAWVLLQPESNAFLQLLLVQ